MRETGGESASRSTNRGGGPRLGFGEWVILLDIHCRHGGQALSTTHPALVEASHLLSAHAAQNGRARGGAQLRSPQGLSRRLYLLRSLANDQEARAPALAQQVFRRFLDDPEALGDLALLAKSELVIESQAEPSRGPRPWFGMRLVERARRSACVYVMRLEERGAPLEHERGGTIVKVGMSGDVDARTRQLNRHLPPGIGPRWHCRRAFAVGTADEAWRVEQEVLAELARRGLSLGGEFAIADVDLTASLIEARLRGGRLGNHLHASSHAATPETNECNAAEGGIVD